jgi:hypothetical protein
VAIILSPGRSVSFLAKASCPTSIEAQHILSPSKCSMKMSPYEGDVDIEQEGTEEVDGIESSGDGQDDREGGS